MAAASADALRSLAAGPEAEDTHARAERVETHVRRALLDRLLAEGAAPEVMHVAAFAIAAALVWGAVPPPLLAGWAIAVLGGTLGRSVARRRVVAEALAPAAAVRVFRLAVGGVGLAWGLGAATVAPEVPLHKLAFILLLLAGLVAGATATLVADARAFPYFLAGVLAPLPAAILAAGGSREHVLAVVMIAVFAAFVALQHRRAHKALVAHELTNALLAESDEQARRRRATLDALFASAPVAIAVTDGQGRITGVNPQFEALFGYTADEAVGRDANELIVPKSERPKASSLDRRARRGETVTADVERRRKDGQLVPVRASAAPIHGAGEGATFAMYEDISDRRRADDALRQLAAIVESSEDAIIGQRLDGTIVSWNAAATRLFGYALGEVKGRPVAFLLPPERRAEIPRILERIQRGERVDHFETECLRKDGTRAPASMSIFLTRDPAGRISGFSTIVRDATAATAARQALQHARDVAERAAQARASFLANMSHEIRTPMNAVLGLSELMLDTELSADQRHSLGLIRQSAEALLTLINDILDLSKIEAEQLVLEVIPFDPRHLVESTVSLLAVNARVRQLELLTDVATNVPPMVRGDPTRLRQVLTNLVGNALKFTHEGEIVVTLTTVGVTDGRARLRFAVRDTGIGISPEKLESIFEAFSQADASMTRRYGGTGLGLAIARRIVRLMGGDIEVTSALGRGSEFHFEIPLPVEAAPPAAVVPGKQLVGRRALVVDDNSTNRRIVREMLSAAGLEVEEAADAKQAIVALSGACEAGRHIHLAIIDAQMPDEDGFELAGRLRKDPALAGTALLMLTSAGRRGDAQRCRELGINGYLTKPAARSDLVETVAALLGAPPREPGAPPITRHVIAESRRRLRVLVAEDNPVNQEVAATMLRKRGHRVEVVADGRAAVEAVGRESYDIVLMDVQMPEMDGFAATAAIRSLPGGRGRDLPIIALTAHALQGERELCLSRGMSGYLSKPYKAHELFGIVEGWAEPRAPAAAAAATQTASVPPVDLEAFREEMREADAEEAVDDILGTFLATADDRVAAIEGALAGGDLDTIARAAHAFKSAAGSIGARRLAELLKELEAAARGGAVDQVRALVTPVLRECDAVVKYLRAARPGG